MRTLSCALFIAFSLISTNTFGKSFATQYCEFQLPPGWNCVLEGTEWVCQNSNKERKKEAIIILAAKIRGASDSIPLYQSYLRKQKTFSLPGGQTQVSEPKYTKTNTVNNHTWVDSLHMASEVPGFYTRYMATVKEDLGVAVTFSVAKDHYNSYQKLFDRIIQTLKVFRQKKASSYTQIKGPTGKDTDLLGGTIIPDTSGPVGIGNAEGRRRSSGGDSSTTDYMIYLLLAGGAVFVLKKLRKKKK